MNKMREGIFKKPLKDGALRGGGEVRKSPDRFPNKINILGVFGKAMEKDKG
jgi:hypothetical protein